MSRFQNLEFNEESRQRGELHPGLTDEAWYGAEAQRAYESGRFEQGLRAYAKVLEFNPQNAGAWTGQVRMLIELGEFREAKLWADKGLEVFPTEPELLAAKAVALAREGDLKGALAFSDAAIEERGSTPYVWLARADVLLARREKAAGFCVEKALALASFHWFTLWLAARVHTFYGQFTKGLQLVQRALDTASDRPVVWMLLGDCQMALGMAGAARNSYAQARELDPEGPASAMSGRSGDSGWMIRVRGWWRQWFG